MTTMTRPQVEPGVWILDKDHTTVGFMAKHLMVTKVRGEFESHEANIEVAEDLTESKIRVAIDAASISTGAEDRDRHLRSADFLHAEEYPIIEFVSTRIQPDGDDWLITGDLTVRDITKPVTLIASYEGTVTDPWGNTRVGFGAVARINREDWGLTWNAALEGGGWLVSKEVTLEIEGQMIRS